MSRAVPVAATPWHFPTFLQRRVGEHSIGYVDNRACLLPVVPDIGRELPVASYLLPYDPHCLDRGFALHHASTRWERGCVFRVERSDAGEIACPMRFRRGMRPDRPVYVLGATGVRARAFSTSPRPSTVVAGSAR